MKPRIPLTDKRFVYTPAVATDLAKRFAAERERLAAQRLESASSIRLLPHATWRGR